MKTLEQVAEQYGELNGYFGIMEPLSSAFTAGAEWQKEQYKKLTSLIIAAASVLEDEGDAATASEIIKELERIDSIS